MPIYNRKALDATAQRLFEVTEGGTTFYVVGSNALLAALPRNKPMPAEMMLSAELDVYLPTENDSLSDHIEHLMGEGSGFATEYGFYVDTVGSETAILPRDWQTRTKTHTVTRAHGNVTIELIAPDPNDLAVAKLIPWREKDIAWLKSGVKAGIFRTDLIATRLASVDVHRCQLDPTLLEHRLRTIQTVTNQLSSPISIADLRCMDSLLKTAVSIRPPSKPSGPLQPIWDDPDGSIAASWESYATTYSPFAKLLLTDHFEEKGAGPRKNS